MSSPMYDLPEHCPIPITKDGEGPAMGDDAVMSVCWCGQHDCMKFYGTDPT
jgi:hypothetical protein